MSLSAKYPYREVTKVSIKIMVEVAKKKNARSNVKRE